MYINEIDAKGVCQDELVDRIHGSVDGEVPLVFRGGLYGADLEQIRDFLLGPCKLQHDRRHYTADASMTSADWWEISYQPDKAHSYAYSNTPQPLHTDNAWFSDPAEINFFVMRKQSVAGGEQTCYPLSRLMADLQAQQPALLDDLCNIPVTIKKGEGDYANHTTIIVADEDPKIFWNYYRTERSSSDVDQLCERFFEFLAKQEKTNSVELLRCESGDSFCFNDQKLLHGRTAFAANNAYDRVLYQSMWRR